MIKKTIQDLLPLVEHPSWYLGSEQNHIKKDHQKVKMRLALVFPELYEIGTSHFGIQILYHIINQHPDFLAERVFCPAADMKAYLKAQQIPLMSLETKTPIKEFDIIGFSLLYELNYTNVLSILELGEIPFLSSHRDESYPLVIAGGPCTCNPEPIADIFDAFVIGDGETVLLDMVQLWVEWKAGFSHDKDVLLKTLSELQGVYVPRFYQTTYDISGLQILQPDTAMKKTIKRAFVNDLNTTPFPEQPIVPYGKPVHDRLRLEVSRGCTRGCRFCQAGMIYRPVRERAPETLLTITQKALSSTGYQDISLLSLSTGDYHLIGPLMRQLVERCEEEHIAISLPSIRAETLSPELIGLIKKIRKTGFTIAPEAGSQRLRDMMNKGLFEQDIISTVKSALQLGWQVMKLYFMVGFPTETETDLQAIINLVKLLRQIKDSQGRKVTLHVSVATFIPKPHTPFQWEPQISLEESREKIYWLQDHLRLTGIKFKWQQPEVSFLEGLWSRGDRKLNPLLITANKYGCEFDGWSDSFSYHLWREAISHEGIEPDFYLTRRRELTETLPWDHIDMGVSKRFLEEEWHKAFKGKATPDCRDGDCQNCGVCDFKRIAPRIHTDFDEKNKILQKIEPPRVFTFRKAKFSFQKLEQAKYLGHLEMMNLFCRAFRRAQIPVKFSKGFHPKPKISFEDPLPVGIESRCETFYIHISDQKNLETIPNTLNEFLPPGLYITEGIWSDTSTEHKTPHSIGYLVEVYETTFEKRKRDSFMKTTSFIISYKKRKGKIETLDLKEMVIEMILLSPHKLQITLRLVPGKTLRPREIIGYVFDISEGELKTSKVIKINKKYAM